MTASNASDMRNGEKIRPGGQTAFILGNGPSLATVDLKSLSDFATIGLNAAYRHWRQIDWRPRYYACLDLVVGLSHMEDIGKLIKEGRIERFLLRDNLIKALGDVANDRRVVNFDTERAFQPLLAIDPITTGSHAALWAACMGYDQVVLLGVDANYTEIVDGAIKREGIELEIVKEGTNPNYYFEGYQARGDRFNIPNPRPDLHVNAWRRAARALRAAGVEAFNGNGASGVRCFPFIHFDRFMADGDEPRPAEEEPSAFEDEVQEPPPSRGERLASFMRAYGGKGAIGLVLVMLAYAGWLQAYGPAPGLALIAAGALALMALAGAVVAYWRFVMLQQIHRQNEELGALRARLSIVERQLLALRRR